MDESFILKTMNDWIAFQQQAMERAEKDRFDTEVKTVVRQLNAGRVAMEQAVSQVPDPDPEP